MVDLGMPAAPVATLAPRRKTRHLQVGSVGVGSDSPVSVQSMCTTLTSDVNATLQQIAELTAAGCQIVRVAVPSQDDADALAQIAKKSQIPVIADIHFQPKYIFAAIDAGCAAVRVNPGSKGSCKGGRGCRNPDTNRRQRGFTRSAIARKIWQSHPRSLSGVSALGVFLI
jgi:(E)-4-hydroxy-3-methylbut-2-enyl-diphosphate synthase